MFCATRRALAPLAAIALLIGLFSLTGINRAEANETQEADLPVFEVFPHDTKLVNFWDSWGARRSRGRRHQGTDIMSPRGTPIVAVADGIVTTMGQSRMSGYFLRIQHDGDWMTVMMHLNNDTYGTDDGEGGTWSAFYPTLMEGDRVTAGQIVGYVGDSGNAEGTRPHTHFELRIAGEKVNPYPYLAQVWKRENRLIYTYGAPLHL